MNKRSLISLGLSVLIIISILVCGIWDVSEIITNEYFVTRKGTVMYLSEFVLLALNTVVGVVTHFSSRRKIEGLHNSLRIADRQLSEAGKLQVQRRRTIYLSAVFVVVNLALVCYNAYVWSGIFGGLTLNGLPTYLAFVILCFLQIKFIWEVMEISERYRHVNYDLNNLLVLIQRKSSGTSILTLSKADSRLVTKQLSTLSDVYQRLCGTVGDLEEISGPQNLLLLMYILLQLILSPFYSLLGQDIFKSHVISIHFNIVYFINALYAIYQLLLLLWPCSNLEDEAKKTRNIISKFLDPLTNPNHSEMEIFSAKVSNGFNGMSVLSLFTLNLSLAVDVLGAATTYLIIIIQL